MILTRLKAALDAMMGEGQTERVGASGRLKTSGTLTTSTRSGAVSICYAITTTHYNNY